MKDVKYITSCSAERLARYCHEVTDDSWRDCRPGGFVQRNQGARVFAREGCRVTVAGSARLFLHGGFFFVLGNFTLMPRSDTHMYGGMLVLGDGYLGYGSVIAAEEKLWIADSDIGAMCYVTDSNGYGMVSPEGVAIPRCAPTIIHEHVFIGPGSTVLKGSEICAGAVIGPRSMVHGTVPAACYAEGTPVVPVEHGITWTRRETDIEEML